MKKYLLYTIYIIALISPIHAKESTPKPVVDVLSNPIIARSLADACEIVRLMNNLEWKKAKMKLSKETQTIIIEHGSKQKDWHGIGAYRGSVIDAKNKQVRHSFSYGSGRLPVHEVWVTYSYTQDDFKKPNLKILGW